MLRNCKDELRQQLVEVTMDIQKLQSSSQELRNIFIELEELYTEAMSYCFPFNYIMLKDILQDVSETAASLQDKWYGSTNQTDDAKRSRGGVKRLLENCREWAQRFSHYQTVFEEVKDLNKKGLQQTLEDRRTALAQQKLLFSQLLNLLQQLQDLHTQTQQLWMLPRYLLLKRGISDILTAFRSVAGLSESLPVPSIAKDRTLKNQEKK